MIARLDRALARAMAQDGDPLAAHELDYCLQAFARIPISPALPPDVVDLVLEVMRYARKLSSTEPDSLARFREALMDVAAALAVQPWDRWAAVPGPENDTICPLHD